MIAAKTNPVKMVKMPVFNWSGKNLLSIKAQTDGINNKKWHNKLSHVIIQIKIPNLNLFGLFKIPL